VFWGRREDIPELLGRMDVYAFSTTRDEGFGIALIEAMAAGLPVVASDVPACREVLAEGEAGRLVPAGDPDALASALRSLLRDPGLRAGWGARATARVRAAYAAERCAADWYRLLLA
jgi:glycosyltransferase involved in cell wall biosynthesis